MMQTGQNVLDKKWYFPIVSKLIQKLLYNTIVLRQVHNQVAPFCFT